MLPWLMAPRVRRLLILFAGVLVLLLLLAWLALPPVLRSVAQDRLGDMLGRPVTMAAVRLNPLTLTLQVDGLAIGGAAALNASPPSPAPAVLEVAQLVVDADLRSLFRLAPVVESLSVTSPHVRLTRLADGRYDIDDVIERLRSKAPPATTPSEPARFALYNLRLTGGTIEFDDRPVARVHKVESLELGVPFLSNLDDAAIAVTVEPRLAFTLGGTTFDTGARATPFARDPAGQVTVQSGDIDLAAWLPYMPASLPLRPVRGQLAIEAALQFEAPPGAAPKVGVKGHIRLKDLAMADRSGAALAELRALTVALADVQPLRQRIGLGAIDLDGLRMDLRRDAQGRVNLLQAFAADEAAGKAPVRTAAAPASTASGAVVADPPGWQVGVERLTLRDAAFDWQDQAVRPAAKLALKLPNFQLEAVRWPLAEGSTARLSADAQVGVQGAAATAGDLHLDGRVDAGGGQLNATAERWALSLFAPYLAQSLVPSVDGLLSVTARADWVGAPGAQLPVLSLPSLSLSQFRVADSRRPKAPALASWQSLSLADLVLDPAKHQASVRQLKLAQPSIELQRGADGLLNVQQWLVGSPGAESSRPSSPPTSSPPSSSTTASSSTTPAWRVSLQEAGIQGGAVRWRDEATGAEPVALDLGALKLTVQGVQWPANPKSPWRVQGGATLAAPTADRPGERAAAGQLEWNGQLGLAPVTWRGTARAQRVPVHAIAPYLGKDLPVAIVRAEAGWRGTVNASVAPAGFGLDLAGDALLTDLRLHGRRTGEVAADRVGDELLSWQSLAMNGVKVAVAPGAKPRIDIGEVVLADFFAKLLVTEQGRLNLTDLAAPAPSSTASAPMPAGAGAVNIALSTPAVAAPVAASQAATAASSTAPVATASPVDLSVGGVKLSGGRVDFTDRFVRPNYSAALSELTGQLGAFRSGSREMATLALTGRVAGTALLDVHGSLNPTADPLALDIQARATDLELAPLSPYAGKYAGYEIERGKLSMDLNYKIQPDGQLQARNQIVLNQLTFGERIDSPTATKLPVLLAVSLLKDRHGVIDLDLPIGGSINDPQFSVGGLIVKVILNLLSKALTAPFALLSGGDSADLSLVEFVPGTATPVASSQAVIDKVARALADRPSLKMTVTGASDPQGEREAMQAAQLDARLVSERRQELVRAGGSATAPVPPLSDQDRSRLLKRVYGDTKLPNKPRNLIGLAKDIPDAEMAALLKAAFPVNTDTARELALQRGLAVRDALIAKGLPNERLFLAAPKLRASTEDDAHWTPRVQLSLGSQ